MAATIKDIAQRTGLGLATISKYLNGGNVRPENRALIDAAVAELHYVPNEFARSLKTRQSRTIGVLIPELSNAFITSIITTMEDILRKHDYAVVVCDCRTDARLEKEAVAFLTHKRVDGLINMPTDPTGAHLALALEKHTPIVLVDRMIGRLAGRVSAVVADNVDAAEKGVNCLLDMGHVEIGLILGRAGIYTTELRHEGYVKALRQRGIAPREDYVRYCDYSMEGGYTAAKDLLALPHRPTALFVTNYEMTLGTIIALGEAHLSVPEDISLIGFDKLDLFGAVFPSLTLIRQPQAAIGECVAERMLELLSRKNAMHRQIMLPTQLHEGESVRRLTT